MMESSQNHSDIIKSQEPETAWVVQELDEDTNLPLPGAQHIGAEFRVEYVENDGRQRKTVRGVVVDSAPRQITIQDSGSEALVTIDTFSNTVASIQRLLTKTEPNFQDVKPREVIRRLESGQEMFGRCIVSVPEENGKTRNVLLCGVLSLHRVSDDYSSVIKISDCRGAEHFIDPDRVYCDIALTDNKEDIELLHSSDECIEIIDKDRTRRTVLAKELLENLRILDNPKYYEYFEEDIVRTKALLLRWYTTSSTKFDIKRVIKTMERDVGPRYLSLLGDPGIAQYFEQLIEFAKQVKDAEGDLPAPIELRSRFSQHLDAQFGRQKVYRGMMLTDQELESVKTTGIISPVLRDKELASLILQETLDAVKGRERREYARDFYSQILGRLRDYYREGNSLILSVSAYRVVAESLGYHDSGEVENPDKRMYVFECEVPVLSVIKMENAFDCEVRMTTKLIIGDFQFDERNDLKIEMFVPYTIVPDDIQNIHRIDTPPQKWKRERSSTPVPSDEVYVDE